MKPKFCSCSSLEPDACKGAHLFQRAGGCTCACHKAEGRHPREVRAYLIERLGARATFLPTDFADTPVGVVAFTLKDERSEILVEYEPRRGFGLTLVGWCEDEDRTYDIDNVVSKITYWLDGRI